MIFCTKVVQKVAKQMSVNLVQDDVKYQGKYVLCRDMHFGHITAGNYRRRFLPNSNWKNLQLKLAPGVSWCRNGSTSFVIWGEWMKASYQGKSTTRQQATIEQVAASVQQSPKRSMIWHRAQAHQQNDFRKIMKEDCIDFIFT